MAKPDDNAAPPASAPPEPVSEAERLRLARRAPASAMWGEQGALLKLFFSLGITVAFGIVACFLLGLWLDRRFGLGGAGAVAGVLFGLGLSFYWTYLRIGRHLKEYPAPPRPKTPDFETFRDPAGAPPKD